MKQAAKNVISVTRVKRARGERLAAPRFAAVAARSWRAEGATKEQASAALAAQLSKAHEHAAEMTVVFCGDGTVATVRYAIDGWEYRLHRPGQAVASSCLGLWPNSEAVLDEVRRLAEASFGGVLHVSR